MDQGHANQLTNLLIDLYQLIGKLEEMVNTRRPVGIDDGLVVCSDGAVFTFVDGGSHGSYWNEIAPIPGTAEAKARR